MGLQSVEMAQGGVTAFLVPYRNLRFNITLEELWRAYPELILYVADKDQFKPMDTAAAWHLWRFAYAFGHTSKLVIHQQTDELIALSDWWHWSLTTGDRRAVYEEFVTVAQDGLLMEWYKAYQSTRKAKVAAPPEIMPGAAAAAETNPFLAKPAASPLTDTTDK